MSEATPTSSRPSHRRLIGRGQLLLLAAAVGALIGFDVLLAPSASLLIIAAQSFALAAVLGAGLNLLPFSPRQGVITDGLGILQSPFWPRTFFEAMLVRPALREGVCLLDGGRPTEALACFEAALEAHPDLLVLHGACARALADLGRGEEALLRLQARVRVTPPDGRPEAEAVLDELRRYLRRGRDTGHRSG